jgi:hypothetical protein
MAHVDDRTAQDRADEARRSHLWMELEAGLGPDLLAKVKELYLLSDQETTRDITAEQDQLFEQVCQHFGPFGAAIRAVRDHVYSESREPYCRDNCRGPWPQTGHYADPPAA